MSLVHALTRVSLFEYVVFCRSLVIQDITGSHELVCDLALEGFVRPLMGKRQGGIVWRIYIWCAKRTSARIHLVGLNCSQ